MTETSEQNIAVEIASPTVKPKPKFLCLVPAPKGMKIQRGGNIPPEEDFPLPAKPVVEFETEPEPVVFDPDPPPRWSCMDEAVKAARWDLVYPQPKTESFVGTLDVWKITEEQLLNAIPPDL